MSNPLIDGGLLRYYYEVEIGGVIHPRYGYSKVNRDLSKIADDIIIPNIGPWPAYAYDLAPIRYRMGQGTRRLTTVFEGVVSHSGLSDYPPTGNINGVDVMYLTQFEALEEVVWRYKFSHEIIADLLTLAGITNFSVENTGWLMGTVEPIVLKKGQTYWSLIRDIDIAENCRTKAAPSGQVIRRQLPLYPGAAGSARFPYAAPFNPAGGTYWVIKAALQKSSFTTIKNRMVVSGITLPGVRAQVEAVQAIPVQLVYVPQEDSVTVQTLDGSLTYVEDTDYEIDYVTGTFVSLEGGAIENGADLILSYSSEARRYTETVETSAIPYPLTYAPINGSVVVTGPGPTFTVYAEGDDYEIDYEVGTITAVSLPFGLLDSATIAYSYTVSATSNPITIVQKAANSSLPPNRYQTETISMQIIQDPYRAALIAVMWLKNLNRRTLTLSLDIPTNIDLLIGDSISYEDAGVELPTPTPFLVIGYSLDGPTMSLRAIGGEGGQVGTLEPYPPLASFDYRIFAIGDIVLVTLYSTSLDLNDDITEYNWDGSGYGSESTINMVFDTNVTTFYTPTLQVKDATELVSNIYAKGIDLEGSQDDIDSGRYRSLTILQIDEGTAALVMGGKRSFVGPASPNPDVQESLVDTGSPYFSYGSRYLGPRRGVMLPHWDPDAETFSGAHTLYYDPGGGDPKVYDLPRRLYVSTTYGNSEPVFFSGQSGYSYLVGSEGWYNWATMQGLGWNSGWVWQNWDSEIGVVVSQGGNAAARPPGVYIQVFPLTPLGEGEMPPWSNEVYLRYQNIAESAAVAVFPINPLFLTATPTVIPFPPDPGLEGIYSAEYQETYGLPEAVIGTHTFNGAGIASRNYSRDIMVDTSGVFAGRPVWISPEGTIWLALTNGVYMSWDQGVTWTLYYRWADNIFKGNYTMDGEVDPVYRYGYKWGAITGSEGYIAVGITGWSVGRDTEATPWYTYHTEGLDAKIYKGHRQPLIILPNGDRPLFPEDIEVQDIIGLPDEAGFIVNARWLVAPDPVTEVWEVTEIVYTYPVGVTPPSTANTRFIPHPSERNIFLLSMVNGDYYVYLRANLEGLPSALDYIGDSESPIETGGSYLAVTNQSAIPVTPGQLVSSQATILTTKAAVEPNGYRSLTYVDIWWEDAEELGE